MLVDTALLPSRLQQCSYWLGAMVLGGILLASRLPWPVTGLLLILLAGASYWLRALYLSPQITLLWQGDSRTWYWQTPQGQRISGQLLQVRHLGLLIHLTLKPHALGQRGQPVYYLPIWRDQVSAGQWRRLCVLHALNDSQQNMM